MHTCDYNDIKTCTFCIYRRKKKCIRVEDDGSRDSTEELDDIQTEQSINDNS